MLEVNPSVPADSLQNGQIFFGFELSMSSMVFKWRDWCNFLKMIMFCWWSSVWFDLYPAVRCGFSIVSSRFYIGCTAVFKRQKHRFLFPVVRGPSSVMFRWRVWCKFFGMILYLADGLLFGLICFPRCAVDFRLCHLDFTLDALLFLRNPNPAFCFVLCKVCRRWCLDDEFDAISRKWYCFLLMIYCFFLGFLSLDSLWIFDFVIWILHWMHCRF